MKKNKLIKYRIYLFLKQFKIDDIKMLMNYLEIIVDQYKSKSNKLFDFLIENDPNDEEDGEEDKGQTASVSNNGRTIKSATILIPTFPSATAAAALTTSTSATATTKIESYDDNFSASNRRSRLTELLNSNHQNNRNENGDGNRLKRKNYRRVSSVYVNKRQNCENGNDLSLTTPLGLRRKTRHVSDVGNAGESGGDDNEEDNENWNNDVTANSVDDDEELMDEEVDEEDEEDDSDEDQEVKCSPSYMQNTYDSNRRVRKFSDYIRSELEKQFQIRKYISGQDKKILADRLNLTIKQIQKWFVHRREKLRHLQKKNNAGRGNNGTTNGGATNDDNSNDGDAYANDYEDDEEDEDEEDDDDAERDIILNIKQEKFDYNEEEAIEGQDDDEVDDGDENISSNNASNGGGGNRQLKPSSFTEFKKSKKKMTPYVVNYLEKQFRKQGTT